MKPERTAVTLSMLFTITILAFSSGWPGGVHDWVKKKVGA